METSDELYDVCRRYISDESGALGPMKETILGFIRGRNLKALCTCSGLVDWHSSSVDVLRVLLQIEALFKKNEAFSEPVACLEAARVSFFASEALCRDTNERLDKAYAEHGLLDPDLQRCISRAERYISNVLGPLHDMIEAIPCHIKFTNGATYNTARRVSQAYRKVSMRTSCTPRASLYLRAIRRHFGYGEGKDKVVVKNRVEVVPKNWKTHRTIACEPAGNIPFQLAIDGYVKGKLRENGIDLSNQLVNQRLAQKGSIDGKLSTIDLSSASDTVALNTVAWLLPSEWFEFLRDFRSPRFDGVFGEGRYEKFSSMGNGCTFVLETLIFAALCYGVGSQEFSVYGDDIVIETDLYEKLTSVLNFFGFQVNLEKSFCSGPFRESCGGNFFNGTDITPFYVRKLPRGKPEKCHLVNGLFRVSRPEGLVWEWLRTYVRSHNLPFVPWTENSGAGVWLDTPTSYAKKLIRRNKRGFVTHKAYIPKREGRHIRDSRTLFLWHLDKFQRRDHEEPVSWNPLFDAERNRERSWVPILSHGYVRKWVCWVVPAVAAPLSIYCWSDYVSSQDEA